MISVIYLGRLDYATALRLQRKLVDLRKEDRIGDVLLLLEHSAVITLGRNAKATNVIVPRDELARRGVEIFESDRGGDVTFHGPGQLVGYPIFDLRALPSDDGKRKSLGVIEYVRRLEEVLIRACADFGIATKRICGLTGVWTESEAKIAAIGVHISRSVTSHGFALNVNNDLAYFNLIIPCGIRSKPVTSMQKELAKPAPMAAVVESIPRHFGELFGTEIVGVESLEELAGETVGVPMKVPEHLRRIHREKESFWA